MNDQLQQVIDAVKQASPFVWHAAYRYVVVDALIGLCVAMFCAALAYWMRTLVVKCEEEDSDGLILAYLGLVVSLVVTAIFFFGSIEQLLTLDYNAIKAIPGILH